MSNQPDARTIESLLAHADWVRALAGRLVADGARADDVAQDAWVAALERPPRDARNLKGWLSSIVRNEAREQGRADQRRIARERAVSREEASVPSSDELVRRANLQREIAAHVVGLDEPYRTVVLLRWYEGLMPSDIAARLGRPVDTITTQLAPAHEQLRTKLDREHGDRSTWSALLVRIARPEHAAAGITGGMIGGMLVATGWKIGIAAVVALVVSLALWEHTTASRTELRPDALRPQTTTASTISGTAAGSITTPQSVEERAPADVASDAKPSAPAIDDGLVHIETYGRVIDQRGKPVAGLELRVRDRTLPRVTSDGLVDGNGHPLADSTELDRLHADHDELDRFVQAHALVGLREVIVGTDLSAKTTTDASGRYAVSMLGAKGGRPDVTSADEGWVLFLSAYDKPTHDVVEIAAPAITMAGEIVDPAGEPIQGAHVSIGIFLENLREMTLDLDSRSTSFLTADVVGPGRFRFDHAPSVRGWTIDPWCPGWKCDHVPIPETSNEHMRIVMHRKQATPILTGMVLDAEGQPASDALVVFGDSSTKTDASGRFTLSSREWRPDSDLVAAKKGAIATMLSEFGRGITDTQAEIAGLVLRLGGASLSLSGHVVSATDQPCVGWEVGLYDCTPAGQNVRSAEAISAGRGENEAAPRTDATGQFRLDGLASRAYRVRALSPDLRLLLLSDPVMPGTSDFVLKVPSDAFRPRVSGRVITRSGEPVVGATVSVHGRTSENKEGWTIGGWMGAVETDQLGRFELLDVPRYHVTVDVVLGFLPAKQIPLTPNSPSENLEVVVDRRVRVHVELSDSDPADAFEILDEHGEKLVIVAHMGGDLPQSTRVQRDPAGFPMCEVSDGAKTLVLVKNGVEVRRVPISVSIEGTNVIRP